MDQLGDGTIRNIGASIVWFAACALVVQRPEDYESPSFGNVSCCFCATGLLCTYARHFRGEQQLLDYRLAQGSWSVKSLSAERTVTDVPPPVSVVDLVPIYLTRLGVGNQLVSLVKNLSHHITAHVHPTCIPA